MKTIKKTKKVVEPEFIVNAFDPKAGEIAYNFAIAKQRAGKPITTAELEDIIAVELNTFLNTLVQLDLVNMKDHVIYPCCEKCQCNCKKPWYKRFWNWITKPFKK